MKSKQIISAFFILQLFTLSLLFSQERFSVTEMQNAKSIHHVEWESYQNYESDKSLPVFKGRPMDLIPREAALTREVFGYLPYWVYASYPSLNYSLLTTIAYFGVEINGSGNIINFRNWPAAGLINEAHSHGVRVAMISG